MLRAVWRFEEAISANAAGVRVEQWNACYARTLAALGPGDFEKVYRQAAGFFEQRSPFSASTSDRLAWPGSDSPNAHPGPGQCRGRV